MSSDFTQRRKRVVTILILTLFASLLSVVLTVLPRFLVQYDLQGRAIGAQDEAKSINDARVAILQAIGGSALLVGAYATWRRLQVNEEEIRATRDGQVTERFGHAIEHIGATGTDVRIGGIYSLERIARNSMGDRDTIIAILSAFIRGHSPQSLSPNPDPDTSTLASRAPDVQAAVIVLGRLPRIGTSERIRIPRTDLHRSRLWQLNLNGALMGGIDLRNSRLWETSLEGADLGEADLRGADLSRARLTNAWLVGANLVGTTLDQAVLSGAMSGSATHWPDGIDLVARGVRVLSDQEASEMKRRRS
jgi:hypothetical protein